MSYMRLQERNNPFPALPTPLNDFARTSRFFYLIKLKLKTS